MGLIALTPEIETLGKGVARPYAAVGTGLAIPTGVESLFRYRGLLMNDRKTSFDKIRIQSISGFDDADVRDERQPNPSRHGETAFRALYSGRTVTLQGRIEAFSLEKLRDMQMALRMAFYDLNEHPLEVITGRGLERDHQLVCRKSSKIEMGEEQRDARWFRDFLVTLRASDPRFYSRERITTSTTFENSVAKGDTVMRTENRGSYETDPIIVLRGPMRNPQIGVGGFLEGAPMRLRCNLAVGEERWIYTGQRKIRDKFSVQRFSDFVVGSSWLAMPPGPTAITFGASGLTEESSLTFYHRHAWM